MRYMALAASTVIETRLKNMASKASSWLRRFKMKRISVSQTAQSSKNSSAVMGKRQKESCELMLAALAAASLETIRRSRTKPSPKRPMMMRYKKPAILAYSLGEVSIAVVMVVDVSQDAVLIPVLLSGLRVKTPYGSDRAPRAAQPHCCKEKDRGDYQPGPQIWVAEEMMWNQRGGKVLRMVMRLHTR